ncbi:MAG: TetR/AcrR family transcriptional regulator [Deltaproteobacteria bacterium]|nr:MAG: TetR/AcrR family transcriptional regulator [Deltaproteobacteria bacterium]
MARRKHAISYEEERQRILSVASHIFREEGPHALTNRRLADAAGCTTMTIYSRFGSKGGILSALFEEGIQRFREGQDSVPLNENPLIELSALVLKYRQTALTYSNHYQLIFGPPLPEFTPDEDDRDMLLSTYSRLKKVVGRIVPESEVEAITFEVFALCHGLVTLELASVTKLAPGIEDLYIDATYRLVGANAPHYEEPGSYPISAATS